MKNFLNINLFTLLMCTILSCSDDKQWSEFEQSNAFEGIRTKSIENNWVNWHNIILASNDTVEAPWCSTHTVTGAIPYEIRTDILPEDGWELIYYSVNEKRMEKGVNYIIFHNIFTGTLKVFYYNETRIANSNVIWNIGFTSPQKFLYSADKLAIPLNSSLKTSNALSGLYTNSLTDNASKGISVGWNCFQTQLTYDPEFTQNILTCYAEGVNQYSISLEGNLQGKISGLLLTNVKKETPISKLGNTFSKLVGKKAEEWLSDVFKDDTESSTKSVSSIIASGATQLLSSFIGRFNKQEQSKQYIELTTEQDIKLSGELTSTPVSGYVTDTQIPLKQEEIGFLGNWSLAKPITVYISPLAIYTEWHPHVDYEIPYQLEGSYRIESDGLIKINPKILDKISNYSVDVKLYMRNPIIYKDSINYVNIEHGNAGSNFSGLHPDLGESIGYGYHTPLFNAKFDFYIPSNTQPPYLLIHDYDTTSGEKTFSNMRYRVKVTVTFHTKINGIENTVITTRTYIPKLEWDSKYEIPQQ